MRSYVQRLDGSLGKDEAGAAQITPRWSYSCMFTFMPAKNCRPEGKVDGHVQRNNNWSIALARVSVKNESDDDRTRTTLGNCPHSFMSQLSRCLAEDFRKNST